MLYVTPHFDEQLSVNYFPFKTLGKDMGSVIISLITTTNQITWNAKRKMQHIAFRRRRSFYIISQLNKNRFAKVSFVSITDLS